MDEPSGSYAPRSPDLTPLNSYPSHDTRPNTYSQPAPPRFRESFSLPSTATFPLGQQPPPLSQQHSQPSTFSQQPSFFRQDSSSLTDPFAFSQSPGPHPANPQPVTSRTRVKRDPAEEEWLPPSAGPESSSATPFTSMKQEDMDQLANLKAPGEDEGIVVKTKFPVARIKRIVQADEDVGKVAQVTPVVVSKALELFMISLALKTAEEARSRNSKRVTASHLKQIVLKDEQFDFLGDIVSKIQDAPASKDKESKSKPKDEEDDDVDVDSGGAAPKRRKAATRRRRKDREDS